MPLARWPIELTTSENMDVKVVHGLTTLHPVVDDDPVPLGQTLLHGDLVGHDHHVAKQCTVRILSLFEHSDGFPRDHEEVDRSLWTNVHEGNTHVVLVDKGGRDASVKDLGENGRTFRSAGLSLHLLRHISNLLVAAYKKLLAAALRQAVETAS